MNNKKEKLIITMTWLKQWKNELEKSDPTDANVVIRAKIFKLGEAIAIIADEIKRNA